VGVSCILVFFTIRRTRQLTWITVLIYISIGVTFMLVPFLLLLFQPSGPPLFSWIHEHFMTSASFFLFILTSIPVLFLAPQNDVEKLVRAASIAGYTASEEEKKRAEERLQETGKLFLILPPAYTALWVVHAYFILEPNMSLLYAEGALTPYLLLTWPLPMLIIILGVAYFIHRKFPETRTLVHKAVEGYELIRGNEELKRKWREGLQALKEEEEKSKRIRSSQDQ